MAQAYLFVLTLCLLISTAKLMVSNSLVKNEHSKILSSINPGRLRQMFKQSQDLALEGMYEAGALEALRRPDGYNEYRYSSENVTDAVGNATIEDQGDSHQGNGARQSSLFNNFRPPTMPTLPNLGTNPFSNNYLLRTPAQLPILPTFTLPYQSTPPRPPKTSIIGNNGGYTTLTNDNVVVVNVLSNN